MSYGSGEPTKVGENGERDALSTERDVSLTFNAALDRGGGTFFGLLTPLVAIRCC